MSNRIIVRQAESIRKRVSRITFKNPAERAMFALTVGGMYGSAAGRMVGLSSPQVYNRFNKLGFSISAYRRGESPLTPMIVEALIPVCSKVLDTYVEKGEPQRKPLFSKSAKARSLTTLVRSMPAYRVNQLAAATR